MPLVESAATIINSNHRDLRCQVKDDDCAPCSNSYDADYTRMGRAVTDTGRPMALMVEGLPSAKYLSDACTGVTMRRVGHDVAPTWRSVASNFDLTSGLADLAHGGDDCPFWNDLSLLQIDSPPQPNGASDFACGEDPAKLAMCRAEFGMCEAPPPFANTEVGANVALCCVA